jgi:hypothetical protein
MANAPVLDLTKLSPAELANLQRALEQQRTAVAETAPDYTGVMPLVMCANPTNPHVFTQTEVDNLAVKGAHGSSTLDQTHCPTCGARFGYAPIAVNGIVVEQQHAAALRAGDPKVLSIYHSADGGVVVADGEPTDARPSSVHGIPVQVERRFGVKNRRIAFVAVTVERRIGAADRRKA